MRNVADVRAILSLSLFWLFIVLNIILMIAVTTRTSALITVFNSALFEIPIGVCPAYWPP